MLMRMWKTCEYKRRIL